MNLNTLVIDNFLDSPDTVRQSVLDLDFYQSGNFPGLRSDRADIEYENYVQKKIESLIGANIKEWVQDSFRFQLCFEDADTWIHKDETDWAGILYLTPDAPVESGTGIYRKNADNWQLITSIGNIYNRLALYNGRLYHRSIVPGFGNCVKTGRLTQVFFFNIED